MIARRPLASRSPVPIVSTPSTVTRCPSRSNALRMEMAAGFDGPVLGFGVEPPLGVGVGFPVGDGDGEGCDVMTTSARSRSHSR